MKRTTIGKAAALCGLSAGTLRKLDRRGLVVPRRDLAGRRVYSADQVTQLRQLAGVEAPALSATPEQ
jgi:DNA-binding transcriptional MerR regulator